MSNVIELNQTNFDQIVSGHATVLVDFWAPWCGPCKLFAPVYEAVAERNPQVLFGKVNVDEQRELTARHQIRGIPTVKIFRAGEVARTFSGSVTADQLEALIRQVLEKEPADAELAT